MDDLAKAILGGTSQGSQRIRVGTVSGTSPVEVNVSAQSGLSASYLSSYTPSTNDLVLIYQNDADYVILGKLISGG